MYETSSIVDECNNTPFQFTATVNYPTHGLRSIMPGSDQDNDEAHNALARAAFLVIGTISLAFGVVGIVIPVLPTTPFLLLTAACYARGSKRFYYWLLRNRLFGKFIGDYQEGRGISRRSKTVTLTLLWGGIGISALILMRDPWIGLVLLGVAVLVSAHVVTIKGSD